MSVYTQTTVKIRLLDAAVGVIRAKGYSAATVDDICQRAGVTKGGFFHHFSSKEELAVSAAEHFSSNANELFTTAPYQSLPDPLDRLLGYVDFRKALLQGELPEYTCLLGTMVQETYDTHPPIREACDRGISQNAAMLETDIAEAMRNYGIASGSNASWTALSLALYIQAVIQGALILAKAKHGPEVAAACLDHLRLYLVMLFIQPARKAAA
jgi:TetR/AcrR family transcriptional repressor of nem operon